MTRYCGVVCRRGFTLITVLWVMSVASIVSLAGAVLGRTTVYAARNRVQGERELWIAVGCARRAQARFDELLRDVQTLEERELVWRTLDRRSIGIPGLEPTCAVALEAAGARLDVNAATQEMIVSALRAVGVGDDAATSMADALVDWRDPDDSEQPLGAERAWYAALSRPLPRNAPLADVGELALVRGFESLPELRALFGTEPGRVSLARAPVPVLMSVPGITREAADLIVSLAEGGNPVRDPSTLAGRLSIESANALMSHYAEVVRLTTPDPDAWILNVRATNGVPGTTIELQWRVVRSGRRCLIASTVTRL